MAIFEISLNHGNNFMSFLSPILGIVISAFIAWQTYRKQSIEKEVKTNIATFSYLFSLICKNFEELMNIKEQISVPALQEIDNYIKILDEIEKYIGWASNNAESPIIIEVPNKRKFAMQKVSKLSKNLILSVSTNHHFTYIDTTSFKKEAVLLSHYGDLYFGTICNRLETQYNIISKIMKTIEQYNEEIMSKPRLQFKNYKIITTDENYKEDLNLEKGKILYRRTLFESYDKTITRCLIMSYNAACHLEAFFYHYLKKHCVVIKKIGIPFKSLQLNDNSFFNSEEMFKTCLNSLLPQEYQLFTIPLYNNLKRTRWDEVTDSIYYLF